MQKWRTHAYEHVLAFCERPSFQKRLGGGGGGDVSDQLALFLLFLSDLRKTEGEASQKKKTPKRTKMSVATPSPLRTPASCGSFRKNRRPCRFPFKSTSHGGSFTNFMTKPYTGWRRLRSRSKRQEPSLEMNR